MSARAPNVSVSYRAGRRNIPAARSFAKWVAVALRAGGRAGGRVNIAVLGAAEARALNRRFRNRDYATNVLSFPYEPLPGERTALLGDIAICAPVVAREAAGQHKPLRDHYAHLTIHGALHLLGHDHENDADADRMETLERRLLASFGIPDPYA